MNIHSLAGRMLLALLLIQIFHACGYVIAVVQTSTFSIANEFHLPDGNYVATIFQSVYILKFSCVLFISVNSK